MNKSPIEWCDMTWNPITGCLHDCTYCYARGIAKRFDGKTQPSIDYFETYGKEPLYELYEKVYRITKKGKVVVDTFPWGFFPTFHHYRINAPQEFKTPQNVFVGSDADIFGEWVSDKWLQAIFKACENAPQHRYLFLTKNAKRYDCLSYMLSENKKHGNWWFGVTATNQESFDEQADGLDFYAQPCNAFLSLEPLHERIELDGLGKPHGIRWVIVGAETCRKPSVVPKREWVADIVAACETENVPVFLKNNLADIWGEPLIQQFPWST